MFKNSVISVFILCCVLSLRCDKDITQPKEEPAGKQHDIPWPSLADSPWPMGSHDPQATGRSKYIAASTGQILKYFSSRRVTSAVVIGSDETLYFQAEDSVLIYALYALKPDGTLKWKYPINYYISIGDWKNYSRPLVASDGTIYTNSLDGGIYAVNPDGTLKWRYMPTERVRTAALNIGLDGTLYFTSLNGTLYALNSDGTIKWNIIEGNGFGNESGGPQILFSSDGATLYVGARRGQGLYAFDLNGNKKWFYPDVTNYHYSSRSVDLQGNIYSDNEDTLVSLTQEGTLRWKISIGKGICAIAIDWDGNIYFVSQHEDRNYLWYLHSVDWNGNSRWEYELGQWFSVHLIIDGEGTVYGGEGSDKVFLAIRKDGTLKWRITFPGNVDVLSCPAIGVDGTIYLPSGSTSPNTLFGVFIID